MTATEFVQNPELVKGWRETYESELGQLVLSVLKDESPALEKPGTTDTAVNVHYGRMLEHASILKKLEDLTKYIEPNVHPPRTYARKNSNSRS